MPTESNCEKKSRHRVAKAVGIILAVLAVLFIGFTTLGYYWPDIQDYRYRMEAERFEKEIAAERARILALEQADTYGGKTPEETFDMFLGALKKGDIELASKYYEVVVQDRALEGLQKELAENGNLDLSIKYFTDVRGGEKKCNEREDGCVFERENAEGIKFISLGVNSSNRLWKVDKPY